MAVFQILRNPALDNGMVSAYPVTILPQDQGHTRMLMNFDFDEIPGVLRKRYGTENIFSILPSPIKGSVQFLASGTDPNYVVAYTNKVVATTTGAWTAIQSPAWTLDTATTCDFTKLLGLLVVSDGKNVPFKWDGTTTTSLPNMPKAKYLAELRNRIFAAGFDNDPLALRGSHVGDPAIWDETDTNYNAFLVYPGGDGAITALLTIEDTLLIGKKYSIHSLVGTTVYDFQVIPVDENIGIGSHWSVKQIRGAAYFCSSEGEIYRLEAGARPERISGQIQDIIRTVNIHRISEAVAAVMEKFHYVITLPVGNDGFITLIYDIIRKRWRMSDRHMGTAAVSEEVLGFCFSAPGGRQLFRLDPDLTKDGTDVIEAYVDTLEYHCGFPETEKEINNLWLGVWLTDNPFRLYVEASIDGGDWVKLTPTGVLVRGDENTYKRVAVHVGRNCFNIKFRIKTDIEGDVIRLLDLLLTYLPKELE